MSERYQVAEIFNSFQGEGAETGMPQSFVRFAGCSVGKYEKAGDVNSICTSWQGEFVCDTDYRKSESLTAEEIYERCIYKTICLTGGEPCDRHLEDFIQEGMAKGKKFHLETSGTKFQDWVSWMDWVVVSPKQGFRDDMLGYANELRFVYDDRNSDPIEAIKQIEGIVDRASQARRHRSLLMYLTHRDPIVYISPVNPIKEIDVEHVRDCEWIFKLHPEWRLSVQMHKFLGVR